MTGMIAPWLSRLLEAQGRLNTDGVHRHARARFCARCGHTILTGLDADTAAMPIRTDPTPITALGELTALMAGTPTYELRWLTNHYEIDYRDQHRIKGNPPGIWKGGDVLVSHRCELPFPDEFTTDTNISINATTGEIHECSF
jgi:hypothetical protein